MTRKEFEIFRLSLEKKKFPKIISDPIDYGIQRTIFKKEKLKRLIGVGKDVCSRTIQAKVERWKRQLAKLESSQTHLAELKKDLAREKLNIVPLASKVSEVIFVPSRSMRPVANV